MPSHAINDKYFGRYTDGVSPANTQSNVGTALLFRLVASRDECVPIDTRDESRHVLKGIRREPSDAAQ